MAELESTIYKLVCKKGHRANAVLWGSQSIDEYLEGRKCSSCCSELARA